MSCQLCSLLQDLTAEPWVVHEDASAVVFLHDDWATLGHAVIASKRHVENLSDLDAAERDAFVASYASAERILLDSTECERAVIMKLGLAVTHLHLHIYPVKSTASRQDVMEAIDMKTRASLSGDERARFADAVRARFSSIEGDSE